MWWAQLLNYSFLALPVGAFGALILIGNAALHDAISEGGGSSDGYIDRARFYECHASTDCVCRDWLTASDTSPFNGIREWVLP